MTRSTSTTTKSLKCPKVSIEKCELITHFSDEIPLVLLELNESALVYIQKEQYDNALLLLQKAHGVLDVVDLTRS